MPDDPITPPEQRGRLRRLINRMEIDRATFFALAVRVWQLGGGAVSLILIGAFFSPELRGYYFTFGSLLGWQSIFELGFGIATTNVCSHEWAKLRLDEEGRIAGDAAAISRLISLGRNIAKWYALACVAFIVIVGGIGAWILAGQSVDIDWQWPWGGVVILSAILAWMLPLNALLEGCNQVATVHRFRFAQATVSSIALWASVVAGFGLWSAVAAVGARVVANLLFLAIRYRRFFVPFWRPAAGSTIDWHREVWPLQWRLAFSGLTGFATFGLLNPVILAFHGAEAAGRVGMSWALITAVQAAALSWVQTRVPLFGMLIAKRDFRELDRVFSRLAIVSFTALCIASLTLMAGLIVLRETMPDWGDRFLPPLPMGVLLVGVLCFHWPQCQAMYLRVHKVDPLLILGTISNLAIGGGIWILGAAHGPLGAAAGYAGVVALLTLPGTTLVWHRFRKTVHVTVDRKTSQDRVDEETGILETPATTHGDERE